MIKEFKLNRTGLTIKKHEFDMIADSTAAYATNATESFAKALLSDDVRSRFSQVIGIKDRVKLGLGEFQNVTQAGTCDWNPSDSNVSQKTFEVCPLAFMTEVCIEDLEINYMSDELAKGSNNFSETGFVSFLWDTFAATISEELSIIAFQGDTSLTGNTYLNVCDGLEKQLANDTGATKPSVASAVTVSNVILKFTDARNGVPKAVRNKADFVYMAATNVYDALADAVSENKASGIYYIENVKLMFQGVEVIKVEGASDDVLIAGQLSNFKNITDLAGDEHGFSLIDFRTTTGARKIGVRADAKMKVSYLRPEEIWYHAV